VYYIKELSHCLHVYRDDSSGAHAAHAFDCDFQEDWDGTSEPNMGMYASFEECMHGMIKVYAKKWQL